MSIVFLLNNINLLPILTTESTIRKMLPNKTLDKQAASCYDKKGANQCAAGPLVSLLYFDGKTVLHLQGCFSLRPLKFSHSAHCNFLQYMI